MPGTDHHAGGRKTVRIDQTKRPPSDGHFVSLGTFRFTADSPAVIEVSNADTKGIVVIDAVQVLPAR